MPAEELPYTIAAQNTAKPSLSKNGRFKMLVKKVLYKIAAQNTANDSLSKEDRSEMLVKKSIVQKC